MLKSIKEVWAGFLVGIANIIPGVSGGTLLFLLGLYERTISAVSGFGGASIVALLKNFWGAIAKSSERKIYFGKFVEQAKILDIPFLIKLVGGAGLAILSLSSLMKYLLAYQFSNTYAFFFGLIAVSAVVSAKMIRKKSAALIIHVILGAIVTVSMARADDPVAAAQLREERHAKRAIENVAHQTETESETKSKTAFTYKGIYGATDFALATASGVAAVCAMILPGLSGSLMLILFGQYNEVIGAISNLKTLQLDYFVFLSIIGVGMVLGLLLFARLVKYIFKRWHDGTVAFLIGLMVGSLYALWPFKKVVGNIYTNINILPTETMPTVIAFLLCGIGAMLIVLLEKFSRKRE